MFTRKMSKKNRIVKTWSPTGTLRAMEVGTTISLPLKMLSSPQAMYMAKLRLNAECGWEQWTVKVAEVMDRKGKLQKQVTVERRKRKKTEVPHPTAKDIEPMSDKLLKTKKGGDLNG